MVDKVASVLDPLFDFIFGLVKRRIHAVADTLDILFGHAKNRLRVI